MKAKFLSFLLLSLLSFITIAQTCTDDAEEMTKKIRTQHYIYTKNNWLVLEIFFEREIEYDKCEADCSDYDIAFKCVWSKGDWTHTLMAY